MVFEIQYLRGAIILPEHAKLVQRPSQCTKLIGFVVRACDRGEGRQASAQQGATHPAMEWPGAHCDGVKVLPSRSNFFQAEPDRVFRHANGLRTDEFVVLDRSLDYTVLEQGGGGIVLER